MGIAHYGGSGMWWGLYSRAERTGLMSSAISTTSFCLSLTAPMENGGGSKRGHNPHGSEHNDRVGAKESES